MPKRTYQPKKIKRLRKHGFRKRVETKSGQRVVRQRRQKGRRRVVVSKKR